VSLERLLEQRAKPAGAASQFAMMSRPFASFLKKSR